jgi:hypothetical protein
MAMLQCGVYVSVVAGANTRRITSGPPARLIKHNGDTHMKQIIVAAAALAVIASPAFAGARKHSPVDANAQYLTVNPRDNGYVANYTTTKVVRDGSGQVIGADPDINVRHALRQDQTAGEGGM